MDKADKLRAFKEQLLTCRPEKWEQIPDLDLYMDQVINYMERQHIGLGESGDETLTSAMVNNYVKHGLLPRAKGKKYSREHMSYLTAICLLKQVLSVGETGALLEKEMEHCSIESFYEKYLRTLDAAFSETADMIEPDADDEELTALALSMAVESYAKMLACKKILQALDTSPEEVQQGK